MTSEKIKIRSASISDAEELLKIYSYYVEETAITFEWDVPSVQEFKNRIEHTLQKFPYIVAVSEGTGEILGYAYTSTFKARAAYAWSVESSIYVKKDRLIREILGKTGDWINIEAPFHCDYGYNIEVGQWFFANYNLIILDVGKVKIGDHVQIAPNVAIYTAGHPVHPESRNSGYEYGIDVTIGNNVWIGGNTCILPGVTVGDNVVIGAGSVVTKDIPANVIAVGNPCRVVREITEADRDYYFRDRKFDVDDYK